MFSCFIRQTSDDEGDHENNIGSESDDSASVEVVEIDFYRGYFPDILNMTSLATLIYTEMSTRGKDTSYSLGECYSDEEDDRLTLAYEKLHTVPKTLVNRFGASIKILDISHNKICNLEFLEHFENLTSLIADKNLINDSSYLPKMPKLELLWMNHCKITNLHPWIKKLQHSCPGLNHISLMGNGAAPSYLNGGTFYEYLQYRLYVISLFPHLRHLDDRPVTDDQRNEAKRLYKRPLLERLRYLHQNEYPLSTAMQFDLLSRWRHLQHRMTGIFLTISNNNSHNNFMI